MSLRLGIAVEPTRVTVVAVRGRRIVWAAEAGYEDVADLARTLALLAAERPRNARRATVGLSAELARVKDVAGLPRLSRADLAAHVRLNSRRYFLQNGVPLVTDAVWRTGNGARDGVARLAGARAPLVDAISEGLAQASLRCEAILPAALLEHPAPDAMAPGADALGDRWPTYRTAYLAATSRAITVSLVPDALRAERRTRDRRALLRWAVAAATALLFAAVSWTFSVVRTERAAKRELAALRPALRGALAMRADLDAATEALGMLARADQGRGRRARFVAALARALPDSAFLVSLRLEPSGEGQISGYAVRAAAVTARLERARIMTGTRLDGPVMREVLAGREWERFSLRFRVAEPVVAP